VSGGLIDPETAERVLAAALGSGGEFAEVFAERRKSMGMSIDESRISRDEWKLRRFGRGARQGRRPARRVS